VRAHSIVIAINLKGIANQDKLQTPTFNRRALSKESLGWKLMFLLPACLFLPYSENNMYIGWSILVFLLSTHNLESDWMTIVCFWAKIILLTISIEPENHELKRLKLKT